MVEVRKASIMSSDAAQLILELSEELKRITENSGRSSFQFNAMENQRAAFFIAYLDGKVVGCGAVQEYTSDIAEIKRMYSRKSGIGIGRAIIVALENEARRLGYNSIILETRKVNRTAVSFYLNNGYQICDNYGKYIGRDEAICFIKNIQQIPFNQEDLDNGETNVDLH